MINFAPANSVEIWDEIRLRGKLEDLANATKKGYWIHKDLTVTKSSCLGRCFWSIIGKRFECLRRDFYDIDLKMSKRYLEHIANKIEQDKIDDTELVNLFFYAVGNFEEITNYHYRINLPTKLFQIAHQPSPQAPAPTALPATINVSVTPPDPIIETRVVEVAHPVFVDVPVPIPVDPYLPMRRYIRPVVYPRSLDIPYSFTPERSVPIMTGGRQIPGTGRSEPIRNVAADLQSRGIQVVSSPVVTSPTYVSPSSNIGGRQIPGTGRSEPLRNVAADLQSRGIQVSSRPTVTAPTYIPVARQSSDLGGRQIPGTGRSSFAAPSFTASSRPVSSVSSGFNSGFSSGGSRSSFSSSDRVIPGSRR